MSNYFMFNLYLVCFISLVGLGSLLTVCSNSWASMWLGLEINMLAFIALSSSKGNKYSAESSIKYFLVQALGSTLLMGSIIFMYFSAEFNFFILLALFMKLGYFPVHSWLVEMNENVSLKSSFLLLSWQKLAPLSILSLLFNSVNVLLILIPLLFSALMGVSQTLIPKILAISSIYHLCWMLSAAHININSMVSYFSLYTLLLACLMITLFPLILKHITKSSNWGPQDSPTIIIVMMTLMGIPPFLGFFMKWSVLVGVWALGLMSLFFMMIFSSLINMFMYLRLIFFSTLMYSMKWVTFNKTLKKSLFFILMMLSAQALPIILG